LFKRKTSSSQPFCKRWHHWRSVRCFKLQFDMFLKREPLLYTFLKD